MDESAKPPKSPQQKKAESYAKDRRNNFFENSKASRKGIPLRRAREHRKDRRWANVGLAGLERLDEAEAEVVESSLAHDVKRVGGWKKDPDQPLGEYVAQQAKRAAIRAKKL